MRHTTRDPMRYTMRYTMRHITRCTTRYSTRRTMRHAKTPLIPFCASFALLAAHAATAAPCRVVNVPKLSERIAGRSPAERMPPAFGHAAIVWFGDRQSEYDGERVRAYRNYVEVRLSFDENALYAVLSIHDFYLWHNGGPYRDPRGPITEWDAAELLVAPTGHDGPIEEGHRRFLVALQSDRGAYLQVIDQTTDPEAKAEKENCLLKWFSAGRRMCENELPTAANEPFTQTFHGGSSGWERVVTDGWHYSVADDWGAGCPDQNHPTPCSGGQDGPDGGWYAWLEVPWPALGLSEAPAPGSAWRAGFRVYDRDDPERDPEVPMVWPESLDDSDTDTWGNLMLEPGPFVAPSVTAPQTVTLASDDAEQTQTGGHAFIASRWPNALLWGDPPAAGNHLSDENGYENCLDALRDLALPDGSDAIEPQDTLIVHSEMKVTHSCFFDRPLLRWKLDEIPSDATIQQATLRLCHWGNDAQDPSDTDPTFRVAGSLVQVHRIEDSWEAGALTWNGAYDAEAQGYHTAAGRPVSSSENYGAVFVPVHPQDNADCVWVDADVTPGAALAHARGVPLALALYGADLNANSGKYIRPLTNPHAAPILEVTYGTAGGSAIDPTLCTLGPTAAWNQGEAEAAGGAGGTGGTTASGLSGASPAEGSKGTSASDGCACRWVGRRAARDWTLLGSLVGVALLLRRTEQRRT